MRAKTISIITSLVFVAIVGLGYAVPAEAAGKGVDVPKRIVMYTNNSDSNDISKASWKKDDTITYTYNKRGDVISKVSSAGKMSSKWVYKKNSRSKVTTGSKKYGSRSVATYKKGKLKKVQMTFYNKKGKSIGKGTAKISYNKKGWISKQTEKKGKYSSTQKYSYKFYSNGYPKVIAISSKSYPTHYYYFNKKGAIIKHSVRGDRTADKYSYKYDKKGRVIEITEWFGDFPMGKSVLTYKGNKTKDKKVYVGIISSATINSVDHVVRDALPNTFVFMK